MDKLEKDIWIFALENAVKFNGKPNPGAVVGKLMSTHPDIKKDMKTTMMTINGIIKDISKLTIDEQKNKLKELDPSHDKKEKALKEQRKKERSELPELKDAKEGKVVTRMPPGPSKYAHVGHAISFGINWLYSQMYKGKSILRFDDTNPEVEKQEFVDAIKEDVVDYLGFKPSQIVFGSDHIEKFYKYAEQLINEGKAYACNCPSEKISKQRRDMKDCPHRAQSKEETLKLWNDMTSGKKVDYALRLKIDMQHKNAVMRDPVIMRVIEDEHYRQGNKYKVWPMYDFESSLMDGILGITHVMRSNEFDSRIELHTYIANLFGFKSIPYRHYGRCGITGALTQGREIRKKIDSGEYIGWDDPRLVTLRALRRRGIVKEAIINLVKRAGLSKSNTTIDFTVISTENRKILDEKAHRYFFIETPKPITVIGAPKLKNILNLHPDNAKGGRPLPSQEQFLVEETDFKKMKDGKIIRLMDCVNFTKNKNDYKFESTDYEDFKGKGEQIIHWLPDDNKNIKTKIFMPNAKYKEGISEPNIAKLKIGDVIQFERFGFCRLDSIEKGVYTFWYTHE
jgi:glutamyl-tRNA synthetase